VPIVLFRVDERLIHGQVVVGWGERLHMDRIIVVDDELSASSLGAGAVLPRRTPVRRCGVHHRREAKRDLPIWRQDARRVVVLVRDLETLAAARGDGARSEEEINLGGIHFAPGTRAHPALPLPQQAEQAELQRISATGASLSARDLPGSREVPLGDLLGKS
jgi:mannose/fructose/N-acetylgalactosamine-specific phosphotransferase system component IIB